MKSPQPKLLLLAMSITGGLCCSLNLAYHKITEQASAETIHYSAKSEKPNNARHSHAS